MHKLFLEGEVHGTTHLAAGQEAVPVGVCMALDPQDYVAGTYRGHGHALAKGTDPDALIAEMLGRATGVCGGRSGSMNVIDLEHGLVGCYGIVGGSIAAATGAALSAKRQGRVAAAFFGDGATNQGYFHECLNFAAVGALPAVFVCENNLYGEFTPMAAVTAGVDIAGRAAAYGMPAAVVDGNDVGPSTRPRARRSSAPAPAAARRSSSAARTATTATRRPTRRSTARRPRSSTGWRATRSPRARERLLADGVEERDRGASSARSRREIDAAVASAEGRAIPRPARRARDGVRAA